MQLPFGKKLNKTVDKMPEINHCLDLSTFLLNSIQILANNSMKYLIGYILTVAKISTAGYCKANTLPEILEWIGRCWYIMRMNRLTVAVKCGQGNARSIQKYSQVEELFKLYSNRVNPQVAVGNAIHVLKLV